MDRYDCSLWEYLNDKDKYSTNLPERVQLLVEIVDVVIFLQKHEISHRDLKPSNILLRTEPLRNQKFGLKKGEWALTDFGISSKLSELTGSSGTPCFGSMEQFHGKTHKKSDNYSLAKMAILLVFPLKLGWNLLAAPLTEDEYANFRWRKYLTIFSQLLHVCI